MVWMYSSFHFRKAEGPKVCGCGVKGGVCGRKSLVVRVRLPKSLTFG